MTHRSSPRPAGARPAGGKDCPHASRPRPPPTPPRQQLPGPRFSPVAVPATRLPPRRGTYLKFFRMSATENYLALLPAGPDQAPPGGDRDRLQLAVRTEFRQHSLHVAAARVQADAEPPGDGASVQPGRHQMQHLVLPDGESTAPRRDRRGGAAQQPGQDVGGDGHAAAVRGAQRVQHVTERTVLGEETGRAGRGGPPDERALIAGREDHYTSVRLTNANQLGDSYSVRIGQIGVEQNHVRVQLRRELERLGAGARVPDVLEVGLAGQSVSEQLGERLVAVDDEDADRYPVVHAPPFKPNGPREV